MTERKTILIYDKRAAMCANFYALLGGTGGRKGCQKLGAQWNKFLFLQRGVYVGDGSL
jgi:hypothetical protein